MRKRPASIPVNYFADGYNNGISIEKISIKEINTFKEANQAHRHDCHSFMLLEKGTVTIEIDFKKYFIKAPSIIYMHPDQVHLVLAFKDVTVCILAITNENLNPNYLALLDDITPAAPRALTGETFSIVSETMSLCTRCSVRNRDKLYSSILKDSCNTLVGMVIAEYAGTSGREDKPARPDTVMKAFKQALERHFTTIKSPAAYAKKLTISASYLNECLKSTTGNTVSYHIQQRVILEAKRLLRHSGNSVKEIAFSLGYDDHHYFTRMFTKAVKMSPLTFRNKNPG